MQSSKYGFIIELDTVNQHQSTEVFKALEKAGYKFNKVSNKGKLLTQGLGYDDPTMIFLLDNYIGWQGDYMYSKRKDDVYYYQNYGDYIPVDSLELIKILNTKNFSLHTLGTLYSNDKYRRIRFAKDSNNYRSIFNPFTGVDF